MTKKAVFDTINVKKNVQEKGGRPMNLWHDISPERMQPEDFLVVIEIEKGSKKQI